MKKIEDQSWYKNQILRDEIKKNKKNLNIYIIIIIIIIIIIKRLRTKFDIINK
jgi:hypothetical protein